MINSQGGRQENQGLMPEAVAERPAWRRFRQRET